jgi:hypothetical protein
MQAPWDMIATIAVPDQSFRMMQVTVVAWKAIQIHCSVPDICDIHLSGRKKLIFIFARSYRSEKAFSPFYELRTFCEQLDGWAVATAQRETKEKLDGNMENPDLTLMFSYL